MSSYFGGEAEEKKSESLRTYLQQASSSLKNVTDQSAAILGLAEKTRMEELEEACCGCCPAMTYSQRFTGYCVCLALAFCLTVGAATRLVELIQGNPAPFAIFYTFENVTSIASSFFLSGPWNQLKRMCDKTRYIASFLYFFCLFATLFFVFFEDLPTAARLSLIFFFIVAQWCALLWYTLSYIPYAREYIVSCCGDCCADAFCPCLKVGSQNED